MRRLTLLLFGLATLSGCQLGSVLGTSKQEDRAINRPLTSPNETIRTQAADARSASGL
jgi:hypothetical protein